MKMKRKTFTKTLNNGIYVVSILIKTINFMGRSTKIYCRHYGLQTPKWKTKKIAQL